MFYYYDYDSPAGKLTIAGTDDSIVGLWVENQRFFMDILLGKDSCKRETEVIMSAKVWLDRYFNHEKPQVRELPIKFLGTEFQILVWQMLAQIPYGTVMTYGDIAKEIAIKCGVKKMSAQAVGGAVGRNPISIIVPCHRVVGANGKLTGYSGGVEMKRKLLEFEKQV